MNGVDKSGFGKRKIGFEIQEFKAVLLFEQLPNEAQKV